jgi:hypothetical protein
MTLLDVRQPIIFRCAPVKTLARIALSCLSLTIGQKIPKRSGSPVIWTESFNHRYYPSPRCLEKNDLGCRLNCGGPEKSPEA